MVHAMRVSCQTMRIVLIATTLKMWRKMKGLDDLEDASEESRENIESYSLGSIHRPTRSESHSTHDQGP